MRIGSILENQKIEKRIAITPEIAKKYISLGLEVSLSENYGVHLGIKDEDYKEIGAQISSDEKEIMSRQELQSKKQVIEFVSNSYDVMINQINSESNLNQTTYYYRWNCSKECLARKGFEHQSHHRGKWAIYLRLVGAKPPGEQLIWKDAEADAEVNTKSV